MSPGAGHDPEVLRGLAERLASEAAALLATALDRPRETVETKSSGTDMVTEMDRRSEELLVAGIRAARPDDAIVGEEGTSVPGTSALRWVIDPLDGTTNYLYRLPGFGVSVAVERVEDDGTATTLAGAVADVVHRALYSAAVGGGATCNGAPVTVSTESRLDRALVATGFSYSPDRRARQADVLRRVLPEVRDVRRFGAAAVDLCLVAAGRIDGFWERGLQPWDLAAGCLIAAEAGATVGDLDGGPPSGEMTFAAAPGVATALRDLLGAAGSRDA